MPTIVAGKDIFSNITDYYIPIIDGKMAEVLFINSVSNLPGRLGKFDNMLAIINLRDIENLLFDNSYYDFDPAAIELPETSEIDTGLLYRTLIRVCEYGVLNWGVPFRRYSLRINNSSYIPNINEINCTNDSIFSVVTDTFIPHRYSPISRPTVSSTYDNIDIFYIPLINIDCIGGKLGIYPEKLIDSATELKIKRKINKRPSEYLNTKERYNNLIPPYEKGEIVFVQDLLQSYISLADDNISNPASGSTDWLPIDYNNPKYSELETLPFGDPCEELVSLLG
jgi:hypothetical protein